MSCPICGKAAEARYRPFCSRRCADIDLARWLTEGYRIADQNPPDEDARESPEGTSPPRPN